MRMRKRMPTSFKPYNSEVLTDLSEDMTSVSKSISKTEMFPYTISRNEDRIMIKATDLRFSVYKCFITTRDPFVFNHCGGDLSIMEDFLRDNSSSITLEENDECLLLEMKKPIILKYTLKKEKLEGGEHSAMILGKLETLMEHIKMVEKRTESLEEQLQYGVIIRGYGVIIPGYGMSSVPIDSDKLIMIFGYVNNVVYDFSKYTLIDAFYSDGHYSRNEYSSGMTTNQMKMFFGGDTLKPLKYLKKLNLFQFGTLYNESPFSTKLECPVKSEEFAVLANCSELKDIRLISTTINDISWVSKLKNLENIDLRNSPDLKDLRPLLDCPKLKSVCIYQCPLVSNLPNFPSSVSVSK